MADNRKILIIEDDQDASSMMGIILEQNNFEYIGITTNMTIT